MLKQKWALVIAAAVVLLAGCTATLVVNEAGTADQHDQSERLAIAAQLAGEWISESCDDDFIAANPTEPSGDEDDFVGYGPTCVTHDFGARGTYYYHYQTDYEVEADGRWTVLSTHGDGAARIAIEGTDVIKAQIGQDGVLVLGDQARFVKQESDDSRIELIDVSPDPMTEIMVGTWHRPDGAASHVDLDVVTLSADGSFSTTKGDHTCSGYWSFDAYGDPDATEGAGQAGRVVLYADEPCEEMTQYLQLDALDGRLFVRGLEYFAEPAGPITFFGDARFRRERVVTATARLEGPLQVGEQTNMRVAVRSIDVAERGLPLTVEGLVVEAYQDDETQTWGELQTPVEIAADQILEFDVVVEPTHAGESISMDIRISVSESGADTWLQTRVRVYPAGVEVPASASIPEPTPTPLPTPTAAPTPVPEPEPLAQVPPQGAIGRRLELVVQLAGEWKSVDCTGRHCGIIRFERGATYSFESGSGRSEGTWTVLPAGDDAARIIISGGDVIMAEFDGDDEMTLRGDQRFVRQSQVEDPIELIDVAPHPTIEALIGTWRPPDGAVIQGRHDALWIWEDGSFAALSRDRICRGYWDYAGSGQANGTTGQPESGQLLLHHQRAECGDFTQTIYVDVHDGRFFNSGLEYLDGESGLVTFFGEAKSDGERLATATAEFSEPLQAGRESVVLITIESEPGAFGGESVTIERIVAELNTGDDLEVIGEASPGIELPGGGVVELDLSLLPTEPNADASLGFRITLSGDAPEIRLFFGTAIEP